MSIKRLIGSAAGLSLALALLLSVPAATQVPAPGGAQPQMTPRPLYEAAKALQRAYAVPVTYEDPILRWVGDMDGREANGSMHYAPKGGVLKLPDDLTPTRTPKLDAGALGKVLDLFHQLNPDGPHFRLLQSRYAFHILPDSVRDENGQRMSASSLLDVRISVPEEARSSTGHLTAICDAVSAASGMTVRFSGPYVDWTLNGLVPPTQAMLSMASEAERRRYYFTWGAPEQPARQALIDLLEGSPTSLSWQLLCSANNEPSGKRLCVLNMSMMETTVTGPDGQPAVRPVEFDRCGDHCPPPPRPQQ